MAIFSVKLGWLPAGGIGTGGIESWKHYVLPTITTSLLLIASLTRLLRSSMLETLDSEFVKLARAKGVSETEGRVGSRVPQRHAADHDLHGDLDRNGGLGLRRGRGGVRLARHRRHVRGFHRHPRLPGDPGDRRPGRRVGADGEPDRRPALRASSTRASGSQPAIRSIRGERAWPSRCSEPATAPQPVARRALDAAMAERWQTACAGCRCFRS